MPASLRWVALWLGFALVAAPVSLAVQRLQTEKTARAAASALTGGNVERGKQAIRRFNCGACHQISGVPGAEGRVGPSLKGIATRAQLAGRVANEPDSLRRWIRTPQAVVPGNGMPDLGIGEQDARDIAAYLYTLR